MLTFGHRVSSRERHSSGGGSNIADLNVNSQLIIGQNGDKIGAPSGDHRSRLAFLDIFIKVGWTAAK